MIMQLMFTVFFQLIPAGITALCEAAKRCENKSKNRYGNIVACRFANCMSCLKYIEFVNKFCACIG